MSLDVGIVGEDELAEGAIGHLRQDENVATVLVLDEFVFGGKPVIGGVF